MKAVGFPPFVTGLALEQMNVHAYLTEQIVVVISTHKCFSSGVLQIY